VEASWSCLLNQAGVQAVWLFYPSTRLAYRYVPGRLDPEVRSAKAGDRLEEPELLSGFSLPLSEIPKLVSLLKFAESVNAAVTM
jgi:Uma2 family endonuclease